MKFIAIASLLSLALSLPFLQQIEDTIYEIAALRGANLKDTISCIKTNCPEEYSICQKDQKCIAALDACQTKCGNSQSCWSFCLPGKGSQSALNALTCGASKKCVNLNF